MDAADKALHDFWQGKTVDERIRAGCAMHEGEKAILKMVAPRAYSDEDLMAFVFYHLHGETLPEDFFVQRRKWLERKADREIAGNE